MTTDALPALDHRTVLREQLGAYLALCRELDVSVAEERRGAGTDREAQMDARRRIAALERTRSAALACLRRAARGPSHTTERARVVVVHRLAHVRVRMAHELVEHGFEVVGEADDGSVALALAVVGQPEVVLLEDRLPWLPVTQVVDVTRRLAPRTVLAVQVEDLDEGDDLVRAGATAAFGRGVHPREVCEVLLRVLADGAAQLPPAA